MITRPGEINPLRPWPPAGDRVRYTINEDGEEIHVLDVDHRRDIYHR